MKSRFVTTSIAGPSRGRRDSIAPRFGLTLRRFVGINVVRVAGSRYLRRRVTALALATKFRDPVTSGCPKGAAAGAEV